MYLFKNKKDNGFNDIKMGKMISQTNKADIWPEMDEPLRSTAFLFNYANDTG